MIYLLLVVGDLIAVAIGSVPLTWLTQVLAANGVIPSEFSYGTSFGVLVLLSLVSIPFMIVKGIAEEVTR